MAPVGVLEVFAVDVGAADVVVEDAPGDVEAEAGLGCPTRCEKIAAKAV